MNNGETTPAQPSHPGLRPGRLWSLRAMQELYVSGLLSVARQMSYWSNPALGDDKLSEAHKGENADILAGYLPILKDMGAGAAMVSLQRIIDALKGDECTWRTVRPLCDEMLGRLLDETEVKKFFSLTLRESDYYENPRNGWEAAIDRFPGIVDDVEEASVCFALSRYAASIFHGLQIVEATLIELGDFLGVTDPHSGWTAVSGALAKSVDTKWGEKTQFERKNHLFLEQVEGTVEGLKNAWRNKISHASGKLVLITKETSPQVAEEILFATRAFTRRLAEGLPPAKAKKKAAKK